MELQTHTDTAYRQLLPTEIRQLEQQGCTAENWQLIEVHPDIDLRHLAHVHFSGSNRIGKFQKTVTLPGGITFHTGIRHATLHCTTVGDDCLIAHVHGYIAHYDIAPGCIILHTDTIAMTGPSSFGNGTELHVMSESGGRDILIHDRLSAQEAYMQAMYRHDALFTQNLRRLVSDYAARQTGNRGKIGEGTRILRCGLIRNVKIGLAAVWKVPSGWKTARYAAIRTPLPSWVTWSSPVISSCKPVAMSPTARRSPVAM